MMSAVIHTSAAVLSLLLASTGVCCGPRAAAAAPAPKPIPIICDSGDNALSVWKTAEVNGVTRLGSIYVAPGTSITQAVRIEKQWSMTAGVTVETGVSASADVMFGKLDASVKVSLARSGTKTYSESGTLTFNFNRPGQYAAFGGYKFVYGRYATRRCVNAGTAYAYGKGTLHTFGRVESVGTANCGVTYAANSLPGKAKIAAC